MGSLGKLSRSINGRVAVVTGAASGMGRATAHLFSDEERAWPYAIVTPKV